MLADKEQAGQSAAMAKERVERASVQAEHAEVIILYNVVIRYVTMIVY